MSQYFNTLELYNEREWIEVVLKKLCESAQSSIEDHGCFNIAISGGSTPGAVFRSWAPDERMTALWKHVAFYWVDERIVPPDHRDSNYGNAMQTLGMLPATFNPMYDAVDDLKGAVDKYRIALKNVSLTGDVPVFDMILLGMGEDGHTASLFPRTKALLENKAWVVSNEVPQKNTTRITMTYPVLMAAQQVLVLFNGNAKKQLLQDMKSGVGRHFPVYKLFERDKLTEWIYY